MPKKFYKYDNMGFLNGTVFSSVLIAFLQPDFESDENPKGGRFFEIEIFLWSGLMKGAAGGSRAF